MHYSTDPDKHAAIFGPKPVAMDERPGRSRKCKVCGDWHRLDRPWPHNCRSEAPPRNLDLATPQITPTFEPFRAGMMEDDPIIGSRNEKREYMKRTGLVEHEKGIKNEAAQWVREKEEQRDISETVKRFMETDKDYWTPEERGEVTPTDDLATDGVDVDLTETADGA